MDGLERSLIIHEHVHVIYLDTILFTYERVVGDNV